MRPHDANMRQVRGNLPFAKNTDANRGRCAKRNKPDQCVYHPAPLTKATNLHDATSDTNSPRVNSFSTAYQSPSDRGTASDSFHSKPKRVERTGAFKPLLSFSDHPAQLAPHRSWPSEELCKPLSGDSVSAEALGFENGAGFINQSAVLAENELSIGIQPPNDDAATMASVSQSHIDRGVVVLTLFKDLPAIEKYIDK